MKNIILLYSLLVTVVIAINSLFFSSGYASDRFVIFLSLFILTLPIANYRSYKNISISLLPIFLATVGLLAVTWSFLLLGWFGILQGLEDIGFVVTVVTPSLLVLFLELAIIAFLKGKQKI